MQNIAELAELATSQAPNLLSSRGSASLGGPFRTRLKVRAGANPLRSLSKACYNEVANDDLTFFRTVAIRKVPSAEPHTKPQLLPSLHLLTSAAAAAQVGQVASTDGATGPYRGAWGASEVTREHGA